MRIMRPRTAYDSAAATEGPQNLTRPTSVRLGPQGQATTSCGKRNAKERTRLHAARGGPGVWLL